MDRISGYSKINSATTSTDAFLERPISLENLDKHQDSFQSLGKPTQKHLVSRMDLVTIIGVVFCFVLVLSVVHINKLAARLGVTTQLVLVGLLLSIMAYCTQRQASLLFITLEARFGRSALQNFDALLTDSAFGSHVSTWIRFCILLQLALPLALSAAYKQFVSGATVVHTGSTTSANYALSGPMGMQGLQNSLGTDIGVGTGVSLFYNATTPMLRNLLLRPNAASENNTFGFNAARISENTTAMLDGPLPAYILSMQDDLGAGEERQLIARVSATIGSLSNPTSEERNSSSFWNETEVVLNNYVEVTPWDQSYLGLLSGLLDKSLVYISVLWASDDTRADPNKTNYTEAIGVKIRRGRCTGKWTVTPSTTTLDAAWDCSDTEDVDQGLITQNYMNINEFYPRVLAEFLNKGTVLERLPAAVFAASEKPADITAMFVACATAMVWSRAVALNGIAYRNASAAVVIPADAAYANSTVYTTTDQVYLRVPTLKQSWLLTLVLCVQPLLFVAAIAGRVASFSTPVSEGFGMIAILAGINNDSLALLRGAAFSGTLRKPIDMAIEVGDHDSLSYTLSSYHKDGNASLVRRKVPYS